MALPPRAGLDTQQNWSGFKAWLQALWDYTSILPASARARGAWGTGQNYALSDYVVQAGASYVCLVPHAAGVFATDLAAGYWMLSAGLTAADLAADDGSSRIGFLAGFANGVARSLEAKLRELIAATDAGAIGDGSIETAKIQAVLDGQTENVGGIWLPPKPGGGINFTTDAPLLYSKSTGSLLSAYGSKLTAIHDGVMLDLTPNAVAADPGSVLAAFIRVMGGEFINTAVTRNASIAFRARGTRDLDFRDQWIQGFGIGHQLGTLDTWGLGHIHYYDCEVDVDLPQWEVGNPNLNSMDLRFDRLHHSVDGKRSAFRSRAALMNWYVTGGSCNGATTQPAYDIQDANFNNIISIAGDGLANGVSVTNGSKVAHFYGTANTTGLVGGASPHAALIGVTGQANQVVPLEYVPAGAKIDTVDSSSQVTLTKAATADGNYLPALFGKLAGSLRNLHVRDHHCEQMGENGCYFRFASPWGNGYYGLSFGPGNSFSYSAPNAVALKFEKCAHVIMVGDTYGQTARNYNGNGTSQGVNVTVVTVSGNGSSNGVNTSSGLKTVTFSGTATTAGLAQGFQANIANIPAGARIVTVDSGTQVTLDLAATGNGTFLAATFGSNVITFSGGGTFVTGETSAGAGDDIRAGYYPTIPGIPLGAKVASVDSGTQVTLDTPTDSTVGFAFTTGTFNIATPFTLDKDCTDFHIQPNGFSSGRIIYACPRSELTFKPELRYLGSAYPIPGFDNVTMSSIGATRLDMRRLLGGTIWPTQGTPRGYFVTIIGADSSSSGTDPCEIQIMTPGDTQARCLKLTLAGVPDGKIRQASQFVNADKYGNLDYRATASGTNHLTGVRFTVSAFTM